MTPRDVIAKAIRDVLWVPGCEPDVPGAWDHISDDAKLAWRLAADAALRAADAAGYVIVPKYRIPAAPICSDCQKPIEFEEGCYIEAVGQFHLGCGPNPRPV